MREIPDLQYTQAMIRIRILLNDYEAIALDVSIPKGLKIGLVYV